MQQSYIHGYSDTESRRLSDQANTLEMLLHNDTFFPAGSRVLEAGCGIGAQTEIVARRSPGARITAVDISPTSLDTARERMRHAGLSNVEFQQADLSNLPYPDGYFDHVLICFVLEHLPRPEAVLTALKRVLAPGGRVVAIEGDHGSFYCYPETREARQAVACFMDLQARAGGDACIGRRLSPLLRQAGFHHVRVVPRVVYVDEGRPEWEEGFSRRTFIAMIAAAGEQAIAQQIISKAAWEKGLHDLNAATGPGTSFHYTFFKGTGTTG